MKHKTILLIAIILLFFIVITTIYLILPKESMEVIDIPAKTLPDILIP